MFTKNSRIVVIALLGFLALGTMTMWAAMAPKSPAELKKLSTHIVLGKVVEITSKTQKSKIEKGKGIHRDRIFTIKLQVKKSSKGAGVKPGKQIAVVAWQPSRRIPPKPGLQGHESIPKKGETVKMYLIGKAGMAFEPVLPNGISVEEG